MNYMFCITDTSSHEYEADKKAVDAARDEAARDGNTYYVWRKVATVTPVTTTEVTMHTEGGK